LGAIIFRRIGRMEVIDRVSGIQDDDLSIIFKVENFMADRRSVALQFDVVLGSLVAEKKVVGNGRKGEVTRFTSPSFRRVRSSHGKKLINCELVEIMCFPVNLFEKKKSRRKNKNSIEFFLILKTSLRERQ